MPRYSRLAATVLLAAIAGGGCAQMHAPSSAGTLTGGPGKPPQTAPADSGAKPPAAGSTTKPELPESAPTAGPASAESEPGGPSALTASLFYEILVAELSAQDGMPEQGFALLLDAARKTHDVRLYQRAVQMAVLAHSGTSALQAVRAWAADFPDSRDARRLEIELLLALGKVEETGPLLRAEVIATPRAELPALLGSVARSYGRAADKTLAAAVVKQALAPLLQQPQDARSGALAWTTVGQLRLTAGDPAGALEAARRAVAIDKRAQAPVLLALEVMAPDRPGAEALVRERLAAVPGSEPQLRIAYARALAKEGRLDDARRELLAVTDANPKLAEPWLMLGTLQVQSREDVPAERSLLRYLELADTEGDEQLRQSSRNHAYFMLATLAERRSDWTAASALLDKVKGSQDALALQSRRAGLLAARGKIDDALHVLDALPGRTDDEKRVRLLAKVQVLRDAKQLMRAHALLAEAIARAPEDTDLLYEQAMLDEKLGRLDEMEQRLRKVIQLKPDNANAYNALGYSLADRNLRLGEARTLIKKAVDLSPDDPFIADSLGWVEYRLGNRQEALRILEGAYEKRPDPEIGAHLGEVLWQVGARERATRIWKEARRLDPDNQTLAQTLKRFGVSL